MKITKKYKVLLMIMILSGCCCTVVYSVINDHRSSKRDDYIMNIKEITGPLDKVKSTDYPKHVQDYFEYYGLDLPGKNVEHLFGTFDSNDFTLVGHIYKPQQYKGTVIIIHGYLNHTGQLNHLINSLVDNGYAVAAFDLPGHGLSGGRPASIDNFAQYTKAMIDFTAVVKKHLNGPYHLIGFSTGGSTVLDYILTADDGFFDKVILAAPLIHCAAWEQSKTGYKIYNIFAEEIPAINRKNSSDKQFLKFNRKNDYLHGKTVPLKWVNALHEWNKKIDGLPKKEKTVKVIQGKKDTTVDWAYNMPFLSGKFTDARITLIDNARHELFNESENLRNRVLTEVNNYLDG